MTIVFEMSTDADIVNTTLNPAWPAVTARHDWAAVRNMNLNIEGGAVIVVLAHGNNNVIGDAGPAISLNAETFLASVQGNIQAGQAPGAVYISTCGKDIAGFAAGVRICAENNKVWANTAIFGHHSPVAGPVPPPTPTNLSWVQIYQGR
ncbi:hypothetical protein ASE98_17190 [Pseudomonas sp. Leaf48]|uniref:hypothetical protein n=1 Tax=Pseudomonas sp. Leaf48 TaxID=1736221 RepID=UPI0007257288|nr:hypothetical protein [Pseudomonas sp. Leaf48]KQN54691.1 hypothetical protein ASE98_17190 [Pseudomonas sp. Leaf48]